VVLRLHVGFNLVDRDIVRLEKALPDARLERVCVRVAVIVAVLHEIDVDLVLAPDEVVQAVGATPHPEERPVQAAPTLRRDLAPPVPVDERVAAADLAAAASPSALGGLARRVVLEVIDDLLDDVDIFGVDLVHLLVLDQHGTGVTFYPRIYFSGTFSYPSGRTAPPHRRARYMLTAAIIYELLDCACLSLLHSHRIGSILLAANVKIFPSSHVYSRGRILKRDRCRGRNAAPNVWGALGIVQG
jgi:hypothetical protein